MRRSGLFGPRRSGRSEGRLRGWEEDAGMERPRYDEVRGDEVSVRQMVDGCWDDEVRGWIR